ncbi:palmitoyltransferase ZDHHC23 isoform 1-T1 [Rhinophrynus dorsalis]
MTGVKMKTKKPRVGSESDETLCCCEYINQRGERSHLAACLCDCEDLDEACDRWISCKSLHPEVWARAIETATDRFRVPWIRGAKKVDVSIIPPLVLLPVSLHIAALHVLLAVVILTSLPVLVVWYYHLTHRRKGKTLLFLSLALFSLGYMYYVFVQEVFNKGHIGWGHFLTITCGLLMTLMLLAKAKQDPGYLTRSPRNSRTQSEGGRQFANGDRMEGDKDPQCGFTQINTVSTEKNWCRVCQLVKPPRSGHCRICGVCVRRMDHHCVWINNCIGEWNHKFFLLLLLSFLFTSTYGIILTLNILCKGRNVLTALFYCPGVYRDYSSAFSYTCVWYCTIVTAGMSYVLLLQLFNISYNVTEREARIALREKTGRCILGGLVVDTGTFNQGFFQNWVHFLSMNSIQAERNLDNIV